MKTRTTMAALAALAWLPQATPAGAQGPPTMEEAIEELEQKQHGGYWPDALAANILRQVVDGWVGGPSPRPAAELDAFADRLAAIVADATLPEHVRWNAKNALRSAAILETGPGNRGTPYPRGFDLLVQVFEGGYDRALYSIWLADSVRGRAYPQDVFERSEPPPVCGKRLDSSREEWARPDPPECAGNDYAYHLTTWCRAGRTLFREVVAAARESDDGWWGGAGDAHSAVPEGLPEHIEDWYRRCSP